MTLLCVAQYRQKWNAKTQVYSVRSSAYFQTSGVSHSNSHRKWLKLGFTLVICNLRHMVSVPYKGLYRAPANVESA